MPQAFRDQAGAVPLALGVTIAPLGDDPRVALEQAAALGLRFVQLSAAQPGLRPRDLDQSARRGLMATLRRMEFVCCGLDLWIPPGHFADPAQVDRAVASLLAGIELAADLGHVPVSVALPVAGDGVGREVMQAASRQAQKLGVVVANHAVARQEQKGAARHVEDEGAEMGVGIDPAACLAAGVQPDQVVLQQSRRLVAARLCDLLSDGLRGPIGDGQRGQLDVAAYKVALSVVGFEHPVVIDARQWAEPMRGIRQSVAVWERM